MTPGFGRPALAPPGRCSSTRDGHGYTLIKCADHLGCLSSHHLLVNGAAFREIASAPALSVRIRANPWFSTAYAQAKGSALTPLASRLKVDDTAVENACVTGLSASSGDMRG